MAAITPGKTTPRVRGHARDATLGHEDPSGLHSPRSGAAPGRNDESPSDESCRDEDRDNPSRRDNPSSCDEDSAEQTTAVPTGSRVRIISGRHSPRRGGLASKGGSPVRSDGQIDFSLTRGAWQGVSVRFVCRCARTHHGSSSGLRRRHGPTETPGNGGNLSFPSRAADAKRVISHASMVDFSPFIPQRRRLAEVGNGAIPRLAVRPATGNADDTRVWGAAVDRSRGMG